MPSFGSDRTSVIVGSFPVLYGVKFGHVLPRLAEVVIVEDHTVAPRFVLHLVNPV